MMLHPPRSTRTYNHFPYTALCRSLVIGRKRRPDELDALSWFCERCNGKLHEVMFSCENIETQLKAAIQTFNASEALRTCKACDAILPVPAEIGKSTRLNSSH